MLTATQPRSNNGAKHTPFILKYKKLLLEIVHYNMPANTQLCMKVKKTVNLELPNPPPEYPPFHLKYCLLCILRVDHRFKNNYFYFFNLFFFLFLTTEDSN